MGKLRRTEENGGGGRRPGDEWCGELPPPACKGWGPQPAPPSSPLCTLVGAGRGPGPRTPGVASSSRPPRDGQRHQRRSRWGRSPGHSSGGRLAQPTRLFFFLFFFFLSFFSFPFLTSVAHELRGARGSSEKKRSSPCGFCKTAVTTLPRVWVGKREEWEKKMGSRDGAFRSTTHLVSTPGPFPSPTAF